MTQDVRQSILIVDDVPDNIQVAARMLQKKNYRLSFSTDGESALKNAYEYDYDLILLDIMMPDMDGFEVCKHLKNNNKTKDIPVIFLTARTEQENILRAFQLGGVDYITKPFHTGELVLRVETHLRLKKMEKELVTANANKDRFISILAHDLRGPFSGIVQLTRMMYEDFDTYTREELINSLRISHESASGIYSLLENLLNLSRLQQGRLPFFPEDISLERVIQETIRLYSGKANEKQITLTYINEDDVHAYADFTMVHTILNNLVSNALKFTGTNGSVHIETSLQNDFIEISVTDSGTGIPALEMDKLFSMDSRYMRPGTSGEKGTGLGLILCHEMVDKNEGNIRVESNEGNGSRFSFTLPAIDLK